MKTLACAGARRLIPSHLENEAAPLDSLRVASHLASCERCSREAEAHAAILERLRDMGPPRPRRDIAAAVLDSLRALRSSVPGRRALKWSALGILAVVFLLPGLAPGGNESLGVRFLSRLGEIIDLQAIVGGLLGLLPSLVPSLDTVVDFLRGSGPESVSLLGFWHVLTLAALTAAAAFVAACLSGGFVLSVVHSRRDPTGIAKRATTAPFDNPPGLP